MNEILPGRGFPIGATITDAGINFCLFSKHAEAVDLMLFDSQESITPFQVISLDPRNNKTYHYWHVMVNGLKAGQLYGYRVQGPNDPGRGHRFDPEQVLLDPYSKAVAIPAGNKSKTITKKGDIVTPPMKSVVCDLSAYKWENDHHPRTQFAQTVIYEMHVAGFTKNPNSGVSAKKRGTYAGLIEKIPYLVELGVTAVELLPVFLFDDKAGNGLPNYWGYNPISFFALHPHYSSGEKPMEVLDEFRDMVKALHRAGIEVILDVVYNHTAEGGEGGPTYSFRGIDNSIYYTLEPDKTFYSNYSGCGNTLNANHPTVRRMIIDSLHFWVKHMHVDGFRFDLASILARDEKGIPIENPPILWDIESDPVLAGTKLIAEAWDAAGLYQVGSFIGDSWKEWNGKFRDDVRSFVKGDNGMVTRFVARLVGSPDLFAHQEREPEQSINFVTCHDGFTLNDLVSYNTKHNEANGENNRDGGNDNYSWNCGVEGPTDNQEVEGLRLRQMKNLLAVNLFSVGAPMILMGDEVRRTQLGNNNAYCQDNEISWFDWSLVEKNKGLFRFVKSLINIRLKRDLAQEQFGMSLQQLLDHRLITWHGVNLNDPDWSDHSHCIACTIQSLSGSTAMHYMVNAFSEALSFEIPNPNHHEGLCWKRLIDTALESPDDICSLSIAPEITGSKYHVNSRSMVVLVRQSN